MNDEEKIEEVLRLLAKILYEVKTETGFAYPNCNSGTNFENFKKIKKTLEK